MKIALLGNPDSSVWGECHEIVRKTYENQDDLVTFHDPGKFLDWLETVSSDPAETPPDLVVVAQDFSGQFPEERVDCLLGTNLLVRWVCCLGPWAESEGRNCHDWPIAVCTSVARLGTRLQREKEVIEGKKPPLALTATRNERFLFESGWPAVISSTPGSLGMLIQDQTLKRYYTDLLKSAGYDLSVTEIAQAAICVCDLDPWEQVESRISSLPGKPVGQQFLLGVTNEISPALQSRMYAAGIDRVLPKLGGEQQLLDELADLNNRIQPEPVPLSEIKTA